MHLIETIELKSKNKTMNVLNNECIECHQYFKIVAVPWRLSILNFKLDLIFLFSKLL